MARNQPTVDLSEGVPGIRITAYEVISGHAGALGVLLTGFLAGVAIWVPVYVILGFNRFITSRVQDVNRAVSQGIDLTALWPYMLATGVLGIALAYLRRTSARIEWYKEIAGIRVGLHTAIATLLGPVAVVILATSGSRAGMIAILLSFGALVSGFIVNGLWEFAHNIFLRFVAQRNPDAIVERAVRNRLQRNKDIRPTHLEDVKVVNGKVKLKGTWASADVRQEVQASLRLLDGVAHVEFEPVSNAS